MEEQSCQADTRDRFTACGSTVVDHPSSRNRQTATGRSEHALEARQRTRWICDTELGTEEIVRRDRAWHLSIAQRSGGHAPRTPSGGQTQEAKVIGASTAFGPSRVTGPRCTRCGATQRATPALAAAIDARFRSACTCAAALAAQQEPKKAFLFVSQINTMHCSTTQVI